MLKKILIGLLVVILLAGSAAYIGYKKLEAQFESFIMAEVERKQAEVSKALEEKISNAEQVAQEKLDEMDKKITTIVVGPVFSDLMDSESQDLVVIEEPEIPAAAIVPQESVKKTEEKNESDANNQVVDQSQKTDKASDKVEERSNEDVGEVVDDTQVVASDAPYTQTDFERDKKKALELAISKLTTSQISRLIDMSSDGFTVEEKVEAKEMFYSNFTAEEQAWILDIYTKYYDLVNGG